MEMKVERPLEDIEERTEEGSRTIHQMTRTLDHLGDDVLDNLDNLDGEEQDLVIDIGDSLHSNPFKDDSIEPVHDHTAVSVSENKPNLKKSGSVFGAKIALELLQESTDKLHPQNAIISINSPDQQTISQTQTQTETVTETPSKIDTNFNLLVDHMSDPRMYASNSMDIERAKTAPNSPSRRRRGRRQRTSSVDGS